MTTKGISQVSLEDVAAADVLGCAVKLIACVEKLENGKILATVMPMLVPQENIIAGVSDVFDAALVYGDGNRSDNVLRQRSRKAPDRECGSR